jgi:hypothetical protein
MMSSARAQKMTHTWDCQAQLREARADSVIEFRFKVIRCGARAFHWVTSLGRTGIGPRAGNAGLISRSCAGESHLSQAAVVPFASIDRILGKSGGAR